MYLYFISYLVKLKEISIKNILFVVPPKVHLLDINGPAHIFYEAKGFGAPVILHFISLSDTREVESSAGLTFSNLRLFHEFELDENDYVFIPGLKYSLLSDRGFISKCAPFLDWLKRQKSRGAHICSVCTGAFLLAETGLLDGNSCTTHWKYLEKFHQKFPKVVLETNRLFTVQNQIFTSAGVASGIDLALYILERLFGQKLTIEVAKESVIYFRRSGSDPQLSIFLQYRNHLENRIHNAQDFISQNISTIFSLEDIADQVNMSTRNLTRIFKSTTGITIGAYIEKIRVERAFQLLAEGNKVDFVTIQCGLKSTNQMRSLLKKHQSLMPFDVRTL